MTDESTEPKADGDAYDLDLEAEESASAEDLMREAVEAVESRSGDAPELPRSVAAGDPAPGQDPAAAGSEIEALRAENKELQERALRALADYENYRKRTERDRADVGRYALFEPMREFLEVIDNLERAIAATGDESDLKVGVEMILRQMQELLSRYGVEQVRSLGEDFDPAVHEAVAREDDPEVSVAKVIEEFQTGYLLHERLLRPAMVKVAVPLEDPSREEEPS